MHNQLHGCAAAGAGVGLLLVSPCPLLVPFMYWLLILHCTATDVPTGLLSLRQA